jgi:hypothetical protein
MRNAWRTDQSVGGFRPCRAYVTPHRQTVFRNKVEFDQVSFTKSAWRDSVDCFVVDLMQADPGVHL